MRTKRVQINPGYGYWDTTVYPFGGSFGRATDTTVGTITDRFRHKGIAYTRIALDDGRTAVAKTEHITMA